MEYNIKDMAKQIENIKKSAIKLKEVSGGIEAVNRNTDRILASVRMLEIDVSDIIKLYNP